MAEQSHVMADAALLIERKSDSGEAALRADQATAAVLRLIRNRPLFAALLAGSLALHLCILAAIVWLEHAPPLKPDLTREIPVDLVTAPPASGPKGDEGDKVSASAKVPPVAPAKSSKPAAKSMAAEKPPAPAQKPPAPKAEVPKAEVPKSATPPLPKPQSAPPKPAGPAKAQAQTAPKPQPPPAQPQPAPQPVQPPQLAQPISPPTAPAGTPEGKPQGLMQDDAAAVAMPKPTDDGEDIVSYQTLVFGMLELKKEIPPDAQRRGAYGTARVYFELNDDGSVKNEKLLESSGDAALDVESLALIQRTAPFPKPPPGAQKIFAADITFPKPD